jgi:hypothetical protein
VLFVVILLSKGNSNVTAKVLRKNEKMTASAGIFFAKSYFLGYNQDKGRLLSAHYLLEVVDKGLVDEAVAAGGRVLASEVPVALVVGTGSMEAFDGLEDELHRCLHPGRSQHLGHLAVDVLDAEKLV